MEQNTLTGPFNEIPETLLAIFKRFFRLDPVGDIDLNAESYRRAFPLDWNAPAQHGKATAIKSFSLDLRGRQTPSVHR